MAAMGVLRPTAAADDDRLGRGVVMPMVIIVLSLTVNAYTLTNLFPYVGVMVKLLMGFDTINESGKNSSSEDYFSGGLDGPCP